MFPPFCVPPTSSAKTPSGAALVLVLAALALVSFVVLAIMTFVRSEDRSSQAAADLVQVRMLASLPEKLVISQIRRATGTPTADAGRGLANDTTWTSQPGMIRVFGTDKDGDLPRSKLVEMFKLYSSRELTINSDSKLTDEVTAISDWIHNPAVLVDLNEPVRVEPVRRIGGASATTPPYFAFPILDPDASGLVDGFKVFGDGTDDGTPAPAVVPKGSFNQTTAAQKPVMAMPVTWMYVLQDGSILAPQTNSKGATAYFGGTQSDSANATSGAGAGRPDKDNPIVGRIAFWTDDESCKLNLNTASEPAPWEPPHTHTVTDESYAQSIPAKDEHFRESGHPAYTSLSPVFRHFKTHDSTTIEPMREPASTLGNSQWLQHLMNWQSLLPRSADTSTNATPGTGGGNKAATDAVTLKKGRLFATVDEFIYGSNPSTAVSASGSLRPDNNNNGNSDPYINSDDLSKVRFFLTAHSRAPELNLFNRPKISLWPLMSDKTTRNQIDKKFALASSLNGHPYYFQRAIEWLGPSSVGSSQKGDDDILPPSVSRNTELIEYMRELSELPVPGFSGKFVDTTDPLNGKWTATGRDQLVVSMFDMMRSGVNTGTPFNQTINPPLSRQYNYVPPVASPGSTVAGDAGGSAAPLYVNNAASTNTVDGTNATKGFGRFPTITKVAIVFFASGASPTPSKPYPQYAEKTTGIEAFVILEPFNPAPGGLPIAPFYSCVTSGLNKFSLDGLALGFSSPVTTSFLCPPTRAGTTVSLAGNPAWGGEQSPYVGMSSQFLVANGKIKPPAASTTSPDNFFMPVGLPFSVTGNALLPPIPLIPAGTMGTRMQFSGGLLSIQVRDATGQTVQTIEVDFPATEIPVPAMLKSDVSVLNAMPILTQYANRFKVVATDPSKVGAPSNYRMPFLIQPGDVVRSMEIAGSSAIFTPPSGTHAYKGAINGDARLLAARLQVKAASTANAFEHYLIPHAQYFDAESVAFPIPPAKIDEGRSAQSLRDGAHMVTPQANGTYKSDEQLGFVTQAPPAGSMFPAPAIGSPQPTTLTGGWLATRTAPDSNTGNLLYSPAAVPAVPPSSKGALNADKLAGDFDNGPGIIEDGPYINMPDTGNTNNQSATVTPTAVPPVLGLQGPNNTGGYFDRGGLFKEDNGVNFSPWRQISSAIAFGSLPTGVYGWAGDATAPRPWQTLLFCPNPASRSTAAGTEPVFSRTNGGVRDHFGFLTPRDHLFLENFWMPVVEPDGVSDSFATEGKVNMNYQIVPFLWVKRATAMYGALHGVRITAIPSNAVTSRAYKNPVAASSLEFRYSVDADKTLAAFDDRFFNPSTHVT
ncbi:MAG: Verru Chthon cassette protein, partial [Verrucomicrobiaceae bacterium]|nr:Verru Chthon cassette protein [Verrucomicrobiaceae bacterium]